MSIAWGDFKSLVKNRVSLHNTSVVELDSIVEGSDFATYCWRYFNDYMQVSRELLVDNITVTVAEDDQNLDLSDSNVCAKPIWFIGYCWLDTIPIAAFEYAAMIRVYPPMINTDSGSPRAWAQSDDGNLNFDRPFDASSAAKTVKIGGFSLHPALTVGSEDDVTLQLHRRSIDPAAEYVALRLGRPVVTTPLEASLLQGYSQSSLYYIERRAASQKLRLAMQPKVLQQMLDAGDPSKAYYGIPYYQQAIG